MPNASDAIALLEGLALPLGLDWINRGRVSDDWKTKIYQHRETGSQIAVYDRKKSMLVLLEHAIDPLPGIERLSTRPKGGSLNVAASNFATTPGVCYVVDSVAALEALVRVYFAPAAPALEFSKLNRELERAVSESLRDSPPCRRERLRLAPRIPKKVVVRTTAFLRNPDVVAEVLSRADGRCEVCERPAPFLRVADGRPYLEVHHRVPLADGGEDTVENAIAACPNCHRHAHYGEPSSGAEIAV